MLRAVLFDYGDTLFHFRYREELIDEGWRAGLAAIGRDGLPHHVETAEVFRDVYLPAIFAPSQIDEIEYPGLLRELLAGFDVDVTDEELDRFLIAEHESWDVARELGAHTHELLDGLRGLGLQLCLVSNVFNPGWLIRRDLDALGLAERLDAIVLSSEVGKRKPHPAIYAAATDALDVSPEDCLFVGDRRYEDVRGPAELGMRTALARWFRVDDDPRGADPDVVADDPLDVLAYARRLLAAG